MLTSVRTQVLLSRMKRRRKAVDGQLVTSRRRISPGTRFIVVEHTNTIHDIAREKPDCNLEDGFARGTATVWKGALSGARRRSLTLHDLCIGKTSADTFNGAKTILLSMNVPRRDVSAIGDLVEREQWGLRLAIGFERNQDRVEMHDRLDQLGIPAIFSQAHRIRDVDREPEAWGEPSVHIEINDAPNAALPEPRDVLAELFVPRSLHEDERSIEAFTKRTMNALFRVKSVRDAFQRHHRRYGYGDMLVYGHSCATVDDWISPRPTPDCGEWANGSHSGSGHNNVGTCYS